MRRGLAGFVLGSYLLAIACGPAAAATTTRSSTTTTSTTSKNSTTPTASLWVGVAQTVVVGTSATGKLSGTPRVFTQFSANGSGPATLKVPMSAAGFRNLSGWGKPPVTDGYAVWNLQLTGPTSQRSIAHFPSAKLPVLVSVAYELNGKKVKAQDIVGKSGELKVSYVITNPTTEPTTVTFKNSLGSKETTTVKAPLPVAADLSVTVPADFTNVKAPGASANGNGNGTSTAAWTLFLFDPLGGVKQSVTYEAHVTNAVVPSATLEAEVLPPSTIKPLPTIHEPGPPAVPVVTLGGRLASFQLKFQAELAKLSAKASAALDAFKKVAVPRVQAVSTGAANLAGRLPSLSAAAKAASANALTTSTSLSQASVAAADDSTTVASNVQSDLNQAATGAADTSTRVATGVESGLNQAARAAAQASTGAGDLQSGLNHAAAEAADGSTRMGGLETSLNQAASEATGAASQIASIRTALEALPEEVQGTAAYTALHAQVVDLEANLTAHATGLTAAASVGGNLNNLLTAHAARLTATAAKFGVLSHRLTALSDRLTRTSSAAANVLGVRLTALSGLLARTSSTAANVLGAGLNGLSGLLARTSSFAADSLAPDALTASTKLAGLVPTANALSSNAAKTAATLAGATLPGRKRQPKAIQPKQVGGGAHLDKAFGDLDAAITDAGNKVDGVYAYLTALDKRATDNKLPAGNAIGATVQAGAFVYSISGANNTAHQTHLAIFIGGFIFTLGLTFGIGLYRIRRGLPSSLAPPKSSPAAAKG
jgi:hypothetical protein